MGVKNIVSKIIGPIYKPLLFSSARQANSFTRAIKKEEIINNTVFYESRDGQSITDSPFAIFKYLLSADGFENHQHIWSYVPGTEINLMIKKYQVLPNVTFVERNSKAYINWLAKAEVVINNATLQSFYFKREGQKYINTWHGTPLKTMGFDMPGNPAGAKNVVRNFFQTDYLLSPNSHTTKMFLDSYRLKGLYRGEIIEAGYPRIDQTLTIEKLAIIDEIKQYKKNIDSSKEIIMYTPTWKGTNLSSARNDVQQIISEMAILRETYGEKYNVLVKVHPFLYATASKNKTLTPFLMPDVLDTNELLGITDILITDYSSIFFDFLVTDKPILFYCWDDDLYTEERGKYFDYSELPGPVAYTINELVEALGNIEQVKTDFSTNYQTFKEKFVSYDDGKATQRYVDYIFKGNTAADLVIHKNTNSKKQLLIYPGGLRNNGITSSVINLINNIDYTKYEVTCLCDQSNTREQILNIEQLPKEVHLFFRFGTPLYSRADSYRDLLTQRYGFNKKFKWRYPTQAYEREIQRLVGTLSFDSAIDFSGYSLYWAKFVLSIKARAHYMYMHSDMKSDLNRTVNGKKIHKINLQGVFSVYNQFDKLLQVSQATLDVNQKAFETEIANDKFSIVRNTINPKRIFQNNDENVTEVKSAVSARNDLCRLLNDVASVSFWNQNPSIEGSICHQVSVKKDDTFLLIGEVTINEVTYAKVMRRNCYLGWAESEQFIVKDDEKISEKAVSYLALINTSKNSYLYTQPLNLPGSKKIINALCMRNIYIEVKKIITTSKGAFIQVEMNNVVLGWLPVGDTKASKRLNRKKTVKDKLTYVPLKQFVYFKSKLKNKSRIKNIIKKCNQALSVELEVPVSNDKFEKELIKVTTINEEGVKNSTGKFIPFPATSEPVFVTMGRLSPEKQQILLIRAFSQYYKTYQKGYLYLIGQGGEFQHLSNEIAELNLKDRVILTGQIANPFEFMSKCDIFCLTSSYEGQPMVLLEAMTLGLNILSTDIPACRYVLEDGVYGDLTKTNDVSGIFEGLVQGVAKLEQPDAFKVFDYETYNNNAIDDFYQVINQK